MNGQYPMKKQAEQLAAQGRYGDTRLLHVNELELQGLASLVPGGLTTNPQTGQPEAFAFLIPLLASGIGAGAGFGAIGTAALSGAMTAAATGDIERGLASAVMGAGLGSALGAAGEAGAEAAGSAAAEAAAQEAAGTLVEQQATDALSQGLGQVLPAEQLATASAAPGFEGAAMSQIGDPVMQSASTGWMDNLRNTFTGEGGKQILPELAQKQNFLPIALGGGQLEQMTSQAKWDKEAKRLTEERDAENKGSYDRAYGNLQQAYAAAGHEPGLSEYRRYMSSYIPKPAGYARGGAVVKVNGRKIPLEQYLKDYGAQYGYGPYGQKHDAYGGIDPVTVQKNLRHTSVAAPKNYMAGFNPEFDYFQKLEEGEAPTIPGYTSPQNSSAGMYSGNINRFMGANAPQQMPWGDVPPSTDPFVGPLPPGSDPGVGVAPPLEVPPENNVPPETGPRERGGAGGGNYRGKEARKQKHAEGGNVQLSTAAGMLEIPGGGIAELPNAFTATQEADQTVEPRTEDIKAVAMAVLKGGKGADQVIDRFIKMYGVETFRQVREMILQAASGGQAQTEGMIRGEGGGMDDMVNGSIGADQNSIAVSPGEYIVPADVVSGLGDGSSDAGAKELDAMSDRVRVARGGTVEQPPPFAAKKVLPR